MRKLFVLISVLTLPVTAPAFAQQPILPPKPKVVATPTPKPKKPILKRIFGSRDETAPAPTSTPPPKPAATTTTSDTKPKPQAKPRPARRTARTTPKPAAEKPAATETQPPAPKEEPKTAAEQPKASPPAQTKPEEKPATAGRKTGRKTQPPKPAKLDTENMDESTKYQTAKAVALEDAGIKDLKAKADGAITDSEAHSASVAYNRALFRKIREIEPSLDGYVDRLESAMMKRLNSEKKGD